MAIAAANVVDRAKVADAAIATSAAVADAAIATSAAFDATSDVATSTAGTGNITGVPPYLGSLSRLKYLILYFKYFL